MSKRHGADKRGRVGGVLLTIFGLPFLAVGCFATYRTASLLWSWQDARGWTETEARVSHVDLEIHSDSDGSTYEVVCNYTYEFDGNEYSGERVGLDSGADNIGDWQQRTHQKLQNAYERNEPIRCYVDPDQPARSVLFRELRLGILLLWLAFSVVFSTAGLAMAVGGTRARRAAVRAASQRSANPGKPWLWKQEWAGGTIRAATGLKALALWGAAVFWNGISWPLAALLLPEAVGREGQYWTLVFLLFPLIGLGLLVAAVRQTMQHLKFGRSHLQLKTLPGVIGGRLAADLVLRGKLGALQSIDVALRCVLEETTGSGDNRGTSKTTLWEDARRYDSVSVFSHNQASVSIDFEIPAGQRPSSDDIDWIVKVTAPVRGVNVDLEFNVPVFRIGRER
jgi:hypothetical protein